ncbi:PR domain zinc finger protein 16 [Striga asiatica]|uniref:PR domain zinc finger protein 16 n=1 Tax=Striga asiatica TaxID=4170 RepID=A0A5A7RA75_STRAF|nr:PR domain zinc finger protein 16 [Striga asiatica]
MKLMSKNPLVTMVLTLNWGYREPSLVRAVIINHMVRPNPHQLVALVQAQLRHNRLVPPEPAGPTATAPFDIVSSSNRIWTLTAVDLKALVRGHERGMGPIGLDKPTLCGPIVGIPNRAVDAHGLVLWVWYALVLQVRVDSDGRLKGIGVEILGGIEPELEPLFSVAYSIDKHIGLDEVRFPCGVPQELEIELVVIRTVG